MSKAQWSKLTGFEAWSNELSTLLDQAHAAAEGSDNQARRDIAGDLTEFVNSSWPNDEHVKQLDDIALATSDALLLQNVGDRVAELMKRTGEYNRLTKDIDGITAKAEATASSMRMERITKAIDSATATIQSIKDLTASLGDAKSDVALAKRLADAIDTIEALRSQIAAVI